MKIIVGLGNPGLRYRNTRHNAGFLAAGVFAKKHKIGIKKKGFLGVYGQGRIKGRQVVIFMPMTYMNLSGDAVKSVCAGKLSEKEDILVISDDINLPIGDIRLREKGSAGGHNGLKSIIEKIGSDFVRLRIGVGQEEKIEDMSAYVLAPFPQSQKKIMAETFEKAVEVIETWLARDPHRASNVG